MRSTGYNSFSEQKNLLKRYFSGRNPIGDARQGVQRDENKDIDRKIVSQERGYD